MLVFSFLKSLFENKMFLASVISLFTAQLLKGVIYLLNGRRRKKRELVEIITWRTGGMPSSHAAVVCSLSTSIGISDYLAHGTVVVSDLFIISFWFALVVLRDAMGVRRSAGLLARSLNGLGKQAADKNGFDFHSVKEIQGHTPLEVIVGGLLGIFIAAGLLLM